MLPDLKRNATIFFQELRNRWRNGAENKHQNDNCIMRADLYLPLAHLKCLQFQCVTVIRHISEREETKLLSRIGHGSRFGNKLDDLTSTAMVKIWEEGRRKKDCHDSSATAKPAT